MAGEQKITLQMCIDTKQLKTFSGLSKMEAMFMDAQKNLAFTENIP